MNWARVNYKKEGKTVKNENILLVWGEPLTTHVFAAMEAWTDSFKQKDVINNSS